MDPGDMCGLGLVLTGLGIGGFFIGFKNFKQKMMIENIPTSKIRSIAMGLVEVKGKVVQGEKILKSPFLNSDCVYYSYSIEEERTDSKGNRHWETIKSDSKSVRFFAEDDTGRVLVDPAKAEIEIPQDFTYTTGFGKIPPQIEAFSERSDFKLKGFLGFKRPLRFTEYFLAPNDDIYILGSACDNPEIELTAKGTENIIIKQGENEKFFFISDSSEKDLLKKKGQSAMCCLGFAILAVPVGLGLIILSFLGVK